MKQLLVLMMAVGVFFLIPTNGHAKSSTKQAPWTHLTQLASEISQNIDSGDQAAALTFVDAFSKEWQTDQSELSKTLSDVQMRTLTASLDGLQKDLQVKADPVKVKRSAVEFRLAVDALFPDGSPIWLSMGDQILQSFTHVQKDVETQNDAKFQTDFNQFLDLYQMVYPSMVIDLKPNEVNKIETKVQAISNSRMTYVQNYKEHLSELRELHGNLKTVFQSKSQEASALPKESVNSLIFSMGSLIIMSLLYVGWRKYKGAIPS